MENKYSKRARNSGHPYTTWKENEVKRKRFNRDNDCKCRMKCNSQVSEEQRKLIFTIFGMKWIGTHKQVL